MIRTRCALPLLAPLALCGCGGGGVTSDVVVPESTLANATADTGAGARYTCTDGRAVRAEFADAQTLTLHFGSESVIMHAAATQAGARFFGGGWRWSVRDLTRASLGHADDRGNPVGRAVTCTVD